MEKILPLEKLIKKIPDLELLALIGVSAVLRKENYLRVFINYAKLRKLEINKIYETLLQTYLFAGFPSALISLSILNEYFPGKKASSDKRRLRKIYSDGITTCKKIYGKKYSKLLLNTANFSPELTDWLVKEGYGKVLSRKGLKLKEREIINLSVLSATHFESQLYSHINGAYLNKVTIKEIEKAIQNLQIFGKRHVQFGLKVLKNFQKNKIY